VTVSAAHVGSVAFAGQDVAAVTTVAEGATTVLTFVEQR
jgi:hypothetical protein